MWKLICKIAAACALLSAFVVPPDAAYWGYFDIRVLILLFCLMATVAGLRSSGLFALLAHALLRGEKPFAAVVAVLVLLPFFTSMLVTNDVSLIAFVPFSVLVLQAAGRLKHLAWVVVLQTVAANLGGMVTPIGNPQNLYLYTYFHLELLPFFRTLLPYAALALALLLACAALTGRGLVRVELPLNTTRLKRRQCALHAALFALCLLTVARVLPAGALLAVVLAALLIFDRPALRQVDYALLLTFVCFFIFSGNIGRIEVLREVLEGFMAAQPLLAPVAASQVISNVPAAVLLSGFTDVSAWESLLVGVNIGGLGTPIASLASLISLRLYMHAPGARLSRFMATFAAVNGGFLAALLLLAVVL